MFDDSDQEGLTDSNQPRRTLEYRLTNNRISWKEFLLESSEEERQLIAFGLCSVITSCLSEGLPVYLEGFGILLPLERERRKTANDGTVYQLRDEEIRIAGFEKCSELVSFQRQRYSGIFETSKLAEKLADTLRYHISWNEERLERYLRGFIQLLKYETVAFGHSNRLAHVGVFYALHNRQGSTVNDWFSGADIIITSRFERLLNVKQIGTFERPILLSAWEPLECQYGSPLKKDQIDLSTELTELGYDREALEQELPMEERKFEFAIFKNVRADHKTSYICCSNGLRNRVRAGHRAGFELVIQIEPTHEINDEEFDFKEWVARPLTLAWILWQSSREERLVPGAGMAAGTTLFKSEKRSCLAAIILTHFDLLESTQLSEDGDLNYLNITTISKDESNALKVIGADQLIAVLRQRGLDQLTRPKRTSLCSKTGVLLPIRYELDLQSKNGAAAAAGGWYNGLPVG